MPSAMNPRPATLGSSSLKAAKSRQVLLTRATWHDDRALLPGIEVSGEHSCRPSM